MCDSHLESLLGQNCLARYDRLLEEAPQCEASCLNWKARMSGDRFHKKVAMGMSTVTRLGQIVGFASTIWARRSSAKVTLVQCAR